MRRNGEGEREEEEWRRSRRRKEERRREKRKRGGGERQGMEKEEGRRDRGGGGEGMEKGRKVEKEFFLWKPQGNMEKLRHQSQVAQTEQTCKTDRSRSVCNVKNATIAAVILKEAKHLPRFSGQMGLRFAKDLFLSRFFKKN